MPDSPPARGHATARTVLDGFCMGSADIVPGVSGGTVALILGFYEQLLAAVRSFDTEAVRLLLGGRWREALARPHWGFVLPLGAGIVLAVVFFTRIVPLPVLIRTRPELVYGLFFGLIVGSVIHLVQGLRPTTAPAWLQLLAGTALGWLVVNLVPASTPETWWFVMLSGSVAICAMLLPGISGSFILLILGKYAYVLDAISALRLAVVIPFGLGAVAGLVLFSRFLGWLLARWHLATLRVISGFLVGSLWLIWPFQERHYALVHGKEKLLSSNPVLPAALDATTLAAAGLAIGGVVLVSVLTRLGAGRHPAAR